MDAHKRKIIVHEIDHWRRNKVLPEQYCDFLMNLYQDPEQEYHPVKRSVKKIGKSHWKGWFQWLSIMMTAVLLIMNFNRIPFALQGVLAIVLIFAAYGWGCVIRTRKPLQSHLWIGASFALLLLFGQYAWSQLEGLETWTYIVFFIFCCLLWIGTGIGFKMPVFHFCGIIALVFGYSWLLHLRTEEQTAWYSIEMMWLPAAICFIWIGWFITSRSKENGVIYLLTGFMMWFVPELYMLIVRGMITEATQILVLAKLILSVLLLFIFRKKWTDWIVAS